MKIRKVPADWLDAPRPHGRKTTKKRRGSPDGRGHRQTAQQARDDRKDVKGGEVGR